MSVTRDAIPCVTCGRPLRMHTGVESFCPVYATFREVPHPPVVDRAPFKIVVDPNMKPGEWKLIVARSDA